LGTLKEKSPWGKPFSREGDGGPVALEFGISMLGGNLSEKRLDFPERLENNAAVDKKFDLFLKYLEQGSIR